MVNASGRSEEFRFRQLSTTICRMTADPPPPPAVHGRRGRSHGRRVGPRRGVRTRGDGRVQRNGGRAPRVHDLHDHPRRGCTARACWSAGARARPTSTARSTRREEYADLRAQAEVAALVDAVRRRRARPLRAPDRRTRPRAPQSPGAPRTWTLAPTACGVYRLQLALGGAGLAAARLRARARRGAPCTSHPAAAHRARRRRRRSFTYPGGQRGRRDPACVRRARRGRADRHRPRGACARSAPTGGWCARCPSPVSLPGHPAVSVIDVRARRWPSAPAGCGRASTSPPPRSTASRSDELRAVLAHEQHHRALRDPLRLAVGRVLCQALFFLPVLRPLHDRYGDVAEMTADAAAVADGRRARRSPRRCSRSARRAVRRGRRDLARARGLRSSASTPGVAAAVAAARRRAGHARRAARARLARERQRLGPGDAQPADRLLAAVRARARARAGARLPGGAPSPARERLRRCQEAAGGSIEP